MMSAYFIFLFRVLTSPGKKGEKLSQTNNLTGDSEKFAENNNDNYQTTTGGVLSSQNHK